MGELVDLEEYRLKKEAEEKIKTEEEIELLREELEEIMARLSLSPNLDSCPVYPEDYYSSISSEGFYFSTVWPPYSEYRKDIQDEEDLYSLAWTPDIPKWCIDLKIYDEEHTPRED